MERSKDHFNDWKFTEILMGTEPGSLHLRSPAADCRSTRPLMKPKATQHATSGRAHWYKLHQTSLNLPRLSPGLLGGRPANVPIVKPGMAIIRKLRVDAASSMHSLPGPVAIHLCSFQRCDGNVLQSNFPLKHSQNRARHANMPTCQHAKTIRTELS